MIPVKPLLNRLEEASLRYPLATEGVLVADLAFELIACDRGAGAILDDFDGGLNGKHLPAEIQEMLGARTLADLASLTLHLNIGDQDYSCRTFLVEPLNGGGQQPVLAFHLKRTASLTDSLDRVKQEYHLSRREREVLEGVSLGLTTKELAERLKITPNTVNAFLRLIMIKMGVTTRAGVVGKVLEQNGGAAGNYFGLRRGAHA